MKSLAINMLCFNAEGLIERVLRAILPYAQEAHIIDTGSTDDTFSILKRIQKDFPYLEFEQDNVQNLGITWVDFEKNFALTKLMNKVKEKTKSDWILRVDDDEVFPEETMQEIIRLEPERYAYSIYFRHIEGNKMLDPYLHRTMRVVRLFKNIPEITWEGNYGREAIAYNKHRLNSAKFQGIHHPFLHLGEFRTGSWKHEYTYHKKGHCGLPIPKEYEKYISK